MKLKKSVDNLFNHNEFIALWHETDQHFKVLFWRGEAWRLPKEHQNLKIGKIFGTIPPTILEADTINILVKSKPVRVDCSTCRKWGTLKCPNSFECYARTDKPDWEWRFIYDA